MDAAESAKICLPQIIPLIPKHDAFLVACYSQHPLVHMLRSECSRLVASSQDSKTKTTPKYVNGIFEASVTTSLSLISDAQNFGIVSTGKVWEEALSFAMRGFLGNVGNDGSVKYAGCETTGLSAVELHDMSPEEVRVKMMAATKRLLTRRGTEFGGSVQAICLGCAGMVGLDEAVRQACVDVLGEEAGQQVNIIDSVKAGVVNLVGLATGGF
jgi:Asp/Glu/hydantoin racemase